ncbi:MAG: hypothetical protein IJN50_00605 [Clostridia bacterium]|nr:hypothetical protein [Clostridia bacterium]
MVSISYAEAATEVLEILNHTEIEAVEKIPKKFIEFLKENSSKTYKPDFDYSKKIKELELKPKTHALLGMIYLKYWANEEEKEAFTKKAKENEIKYQEELKKKYNTESLFKKKVKEEVQSKEKNELPVVKKENFIQKIIKKIRSLFIR